MVTYRTDPNKSRIRRVYPTSYVVGMIIIALAVTAAFVVIILLDKTENTQSVVNMFVNIGGFAMLKGYVDRKGHETVQDVSANTLNVVSNGTMRRAIKQAVHEAAPSLVALNESLAQVPLDMRIKALAVAIEDAEQAKMARPRNTQAGGSHPDPSPS